MIIGTAGLTAGWVALHRVCWLFGLMVDFRDGRMGMLVLAFRAHWMAVMVARRMADYVAVTHVECMIG